MIKLFMLLLCVPSCLFGLAISKHAETTALVNAFVLDGAKLSTNLRYADQYNGLIEIRDVERQQQPAFYLASALPDGGLQPATSGAKVAVTFRSHGLVLKENWRNQALGTCVRQITDAEGRRQLLEPVVSVSVTKLGALQIEKREVRGRHGKTKVVTTYTSSFAGVLAVGNRETAITGQVGMRPRGVDIGKVGVQLLFRTQVDGARLGSTGQYNIRITSLGVPEETVQITGTDGWTQWRGSGGDGSVAALPNKLPAEAGFTWRSALRSPGMGGIAATTDRVVLTDRDDAIGEDIIRCFDAQSGEEKWVFRYRTAGKLEYGNGPRTTPLIADGRVYVLGAFGHVHCLDLETATKHWGKNLGSVEMGGRMPQWGYSASPILHGTNLIVAAGGDQSALVAFHSRTGDEVWRSGGDDFAYASPVLAAPWGVRQIIGRDGTGVIGRDPHTGVKLWSMPLSDRPVQASPTPTVIGDHLVLSSIHDRTQLFAFNQEGLLQKQATARFAPLAPLYMSAIRCGKLLLSSDGKGTCYVFKPAQGLEPLVTLRDSSFESFQCAFGSPNLALVLTGQGSKGAELLLLDVSAQALTVRNRVRLFPDGRDEWEWSHPALVGNRLYVRTATHLYAMDLPQLVQQEQQ